MNRRNFIKSIAVSIGASQLFDISKANACENSTVKSSPLALTLSSSGRIGFYIDYSEINQAGTHTFYICRTHGTTGSVSVNFSTSGDAHNCKSGTITWMHGDASVQSFSVVVTPSDLREHEGRGEHRIVVSLTEPTNGAVLHFGPAHTVAYGIIDNSAMVASDTNAVFYDSDANSNGNGQQKSPFNNIYDAIEKLGEKRYLYGKGTTTIGSSITRRNHGTFILPVPATRVSESSRVIIRNWPGFKWTVTGGANQRSAGFYAESGESYQTFRGIDFTDLDASNAGNGFAIFYHYNNSSSINIEHCTARNINGNTNNGAFMVWGVDGSKIWRCRSNLIQKNGNPENENTAGVFSYRGKNLSIQRFEAQASSALLYHKQVEKPFDVSASVRFCVDNTGLGVHFGASGRSSVPHSYTIVQSNLFLPNGGIGIYHKTGIQGFNGQNNATKHWWCHNVFDGRARGDNGAIRGTQIYNAAIFNNIFQNCRKLWEDATDSTEFGPSVEFANFNIEEGTTYFNKYEWRGINFSSARDLNAASGLASNDIKGAIKFKDTKSKNYTLQSDSVARNAGSGGVDCGIYFTGAEKIGMNDPLENRNFFKL